MITACWKIRMRVLLCLLLVSVSTTAFWQSSTRGRLYPFRDNCNRKQSGKVLFLSPLNSNPVRVETQNICVMVDGDTDGFQEEATAIADNLGIPLLSIEQANGIESAGTEIAAMTHALRLVPCDCGDKPESTFALAIEPIESGADPKEERKKKKRKKSKSSPFYVDLCPPANSKAGRRASGASGKADLLVKAVAPGKGNGLVVYDLTAGLGQDSLILAANGAKQVTMVERHPIVAALLQDAMRRLQLQFSNDTVLAEKLRFLQGDAREVLQSTKPSDCDVIYLDPMFPPRQKQSAVKKGMTILHGLLETHIQDQEEVRRAEEQELLDASLDVAKLRVVVKRPAKAPLLGDGSTKPSHALTGSVNRWDVYVTKRE